MLVKINIEIFSHESKDEETKYVSFRKSLCYFLFPYPYFRQIMWWILEKRSWWHGNIFKICRIFAKVVLRSAHIFSAKTSANVTLYLCLLSKHQTLKKMKKIYHYFIAGKHFFFILEQAGNSINGQSTICLSQSAHWKKGVITTIKNHFNRVRKQIQLVFHNIYFLSDLGWLFQSPLYWL